MTVSLLAYCIGHDRILCRVSFEKESEGSPNYISVIYCTGSVSDRIFSNICYGVQLKDRSDSK